MDELELTATSSNVVLSDTDKCLIRSRMADTRREIEILDEELSRLQSARVGKFVRVAKLKAMISPIREFPNEIIAEIISKSSDDTVTIKFPMGDYLSLEPWNLSQVCSKWRGVAFAMPQLWNDAQIVYNVPRARDLAILTQRLALFFSRSGRSSLSLDVFAHAFHRPHDTFLYKTIITLLAPYSPRLRHISFDPAEYVPKVFELSGNKMNSLESLSMNMGFTDNHIPFKFDDVPKLREFTLSEAPHALTLDNLVHLPWERLTTLHTSDVLLSHGSGHEVLRHCHSLISCAFTIESDDGEPAVPDEIIMVHLEILEVTAFSDSGNYGGFFRALVAPSLKDFSLISEDGTDWLDGELTSFVSRSSCEVEIFSITFAGEDVDTLLHVMPSVVHFTHNHYCGPEMLEEMGTGDLFPRLRTFICGGSSRLNEVVMMLESRSRKLSPDKRSERKDTLRMVESVTYTVNEGCWVNRYSMRCLEEIVDEGLAFVFVDKRIKVPERL